MYEYEIIYWLDCDKVPVELMTAVLLLVGNVILTINSRNLKVSTLYLTVPLILTDGPYPIILTGIIVTV